MSGRHPQTSHRIHQIKAIETVLPPTLNVRNKFVQENVKTGIHGQKKKWLYLNRHEQGHRETALYNRRCESQKSRICDTVQVVQM